MRMEPGALTDLVIFLKQKKQEKEKKRWSRYSRFEYLRTDQWALSCSQKIRGLNPDRNPCVHGSSRSLGFSFETGSRNFSQSVFLHIQWAARNLSNGKWL